MFDLSALHGNKKRVITHCFIEPAIRQQYSPYDHQANNRKWTVQLLLSRLVVNSVDEHDKEPYKLHFQLLQWLEM